MGLSKVGQHDLNDKQFEVMCRVYQSPKKEDQILYTKFVDDVESGQYTHFWGVCYRAEQVVKDECTIEASFPKNKRTNTRSFRYQS